jgi:hypothetical protein
MAVAVQVVRGGGGAVSAAVGGRQAGPEDGNSELKMVGRIHMVGSSGVTSNWWAAKIVGAAVLVLAATEQMES